MRRQNKLQVTLMAILLLVLLTVAARSAQNGKIAFSSDRDGNLEIYLMNADGSNQTRLTNNNQHDSFPSWSPDGTRIAFGAFGESYFVMLRTIRADGTNATDVKWVGSYFSGATWSPFGDQLAFVDDYFAYDFPMVYGVSADGTSYRLISPFFGSCCALSTPSWSQDGSRIIYVAGHEFTGFSIYTVKPDGTDNRILIPTGPCGSDFVSPKWSRDGDKILFFSKMSNQGAIVTANSDGTNCQRITSGDLTGLDSMDWSPDGQYIVFSRSHKIFTMRRDGSDLKLLTENGMSPSWQPLRSLASVSGKVTTPGGQGVRNATVILKDAAGLEQRAVTGSFGLYAFEAVRPGETYTITVSSRRYRFAPRTIPVDGDLSNVDLVGQE